MGIALAPVVRATLVTPAPISISQPSMATLLGGTPMVEVPLVKSFAEAVGR